MNIRPYSDVILKSIESLYSNKSEVFTIDYAMAISEKHSLASV